MSASREQALKVVLMLTGIIFIFGIYPLGKVWPAGWAWTPAQPELMQMILGIYATLGVFVLLASKNPLEHKSLIWFTVWSSAVHAGIMGVQAIRDTSERGHLIGDVPALFIVAIAIAVLMPRGGAAQGT